MRMRMRIKCECTVLRTYTMEWNGTSEIIVLQHIRRNDVQRCYSVNSACFLFFFSLSLVWFFSCFALGAFVLLCLRFLHFTKLFRVCNHSSFCIIIRVLFLISNELSLSLSWNEFWLHATISLSLRVTSTFSSKFHRFHEAKAECNFFGMHCYFVIHNAHFMCRRGMKCQNNGHGNKLMAL